MTSTVPLAVFYRNPNSSNRRSAPSTNTPQLNAMASAGFLFVYSGMGCALGLGFSEYTGMFTRHFQFSWFIGVIGGALFAAPLVRFLWSKILMGLASVLALASAIIFTSVPYLYAAILTARYLNGAATGLAMVVFLVNGSELTTKSKRGACLGFEQFCIAIGIAVQVIYETQWQSSFSTNRLHGILGIILIVLSMATIHLIIESPIFYLLKSKDMAALDCLTRTVLTKAINNKTKDRLEELKSYVMENKNMGYGRSFVDGLLPLSKMLMYRACVAFSFTLPLSLGILYASTISFGKTESWPAILYGCLRVVGSLIAILLSNVVGRKIVALLALAVMGGLTIALGVIYKSQYNLIDAYEMSIVCYLTFLTQFFGGLFVPSTSVYMGEAFPLLVKPYFIALTVSVEQVIHIIVILRFTTTTNLITLPTFVFAYGLAVGIIVCAFFLIFCVIMPETRRTTLREAQQRFQRLIYLRLT